MRGSVPSACSKRPVASVSRARWVNRCDRSCAHPVLVLDGGRTSATSRYCWPTADQSRPGAIRPASADMEAASPGSVRTRRTALAIECASPRSTRRPAPLASSSHACGKPVETTGRPRRDGLDENPGGHLVPRVVRQQDHVGLPHGLLQLVGREVTRIELDEITDAEVGDPPLEHLSVLLPLAPGGPWDVSPRRRGTEGCGCRSRRPAMASMPHSIPLPGPSRPQVRIVGRDPPAGGDVVITGRNGGRPGVRGPVWHDVDTRRHLVLVEEAFPRGMRHGHDRVGPQDQLVEDGALAQRGSGQTVCRTTMTGTVSIRRPRGRPRRPGRRRCRTRAG